jgi:hypothetical protein
MLHPRGRLRAAIAASATRESDLTYMSGFERSPVVAEAIEDYVVTGNPVLIHRRLRRRARSRGGRVQTRQAEGDGPPRLCPGDLLELSIYGDLNRVRSSRRLAAECPRNVEVIGLHLGMDVGNGTSPTRSIVGRKSQV